MLPALYAQVREEGLHQVPQVPPPCHNLVEGLAEVIPTLRGQDVHHYREIKFSTDFEIEAD
jgi:hypothetical protein